MTSQEEIDDFLLHHGIKGMHWGVRNTSSNEEIRDARARTRVRSGQMQKQQRKLDSATTDSGRKAAASALDRINKQGANDRAIAAHKTTGQKAAKAALIVVGTVLTARVIGNTASAVSRSRVP
jgi:hypothetical protein